MIWFWRSSESCSFLLSMLRAPFTCVKKSRFFSFWRKSLISNCDNCFFLSEGERRKLSNLRWNWRSNRRIFLWTEFSSFFKMKDSLRPFGMIAGDKVCCLVVDNKVVVEIFSMYCSVGFGVGANVVLSWSPQLTIYMLRD